MLRSRLSYSAIKSIRNCIQFHHAQQTWGVCIKKFHSHKPTLYCISIKDETTRHLPLKAHNDHEDKFMDGSPTEATHTYKYESHHSRSNHNVSRKIETLFPSPVNALHNIYALVSKDRNIAKPCHGTSMEYRDERKQNAWKHSYEISWPENQTFSGKGKSKKLAMKSAALKCLEWLQTNGHLNKHKVPILYTQHEIKQMLNKSVQVSVRPELLQDMEMVLDKFDNEIKDIIDERHMAKVSGDAEWVEGCTIQFDKRANIERWKDQKEMFQINYELDSKLRSRSQFTNKALPIFDTREEILKLLEEHQVLLIKGDTGCGKTTQVPQFILDSWIEQGKGSECNILVAQPRRISAVSLSKRVAHERNEELGDMVGYQVRLDHVLPRYPCGIVFCTSGILLRRLQFDPQLEGVSHIIIDEAHERVADTDILMVLLKRLLKVKPNLKLLIMSATINAELFQEYLDCPVVNVSGMTYPVKQHFVDDMRMLGIKLEEDGTNDSKFRNMGPWQVNYRNVVNLIQWIDNKKPLGAILCFLPGWFDIVQMQNLLRYNRSLQVIPIHSKLSDIDQHKIFDVPEEGIRKVILATNIAETSITVTDVTYVVDTVIRKNKVWDDERCVLRLENQWISQANIAQRKGRAGRVRPGESYHLISRRVYNELEPYPLPEISCLSLDKIVLSSKVYSNEKAEDFFSSMPQSPSKVSIAQAVNKLIKLGIIDEEENLTSLGKRIAYFSLSPELGKAMVYSVIFRCFDPVLNIATLYSTDDEVFSNTLDGKASVRETKASFHKSSDHIALSNIYGEWKERLDDNIRFAQSFCCELSLIPGRLHIMNRIQDLYMNDLVHGGMLPDNALASHVHKVSLNKHSEHSELICGILLTATNNLICYRDVDIKHNSRVKSEDVLEAEDNSKVVIAPESVNYKRETWPSPFLTYLLRSHNTQRRVSIVQESSMVSPLCVLLFGHGNITPQETKENTEENSDTIGNYILQITDKKSISFRCDKAAMQQILRCRDILWRTVDYIINCEGDILHNEALQSVHIYKDSLLEVLTKVLGETSKSIDNYTMTDENC